MNNLNYSFESQPESFFCCDHFVIFQVRVRTLAIVLEVLDCETEPDQHEHANRSGAELPVPNWYYQ